MEQDTSIAILLLLGTLVCLIVQLYKNHKLEEEVECLKSGNKYLEDRISYRDREGERNFKDLEIGRASCRERV